MPFLAITDQYPFSTIFSKLHEFVIHGHVSPYLKFKISPYQQDFSKSKSKSKSVTNLVTCVDFISPLAGS
jgi:hypothetical protein